VSAQREIELRPAESRLLVHESEVANRIALNTPVE
jgi:hypothetical protein